jgi:hypothetical protein
VITKSSPPVTPLTVPYQQQIPKTFTDLSSRAFFVRKEQMLIAMMNCVVPITTLCVF